MQIDPESGFCSPIKSFKSTLFPVPLFPSTARISPFSTVRSMPFSTCCSPNDFRNPLITTGCGSMLSSGREEGENEAHQNDVRQNNEQRRKHHGAGCGASDALGSALRSHALIRRNSTDNQAVNSGLERGRQKIAEGNAVESVGDEKLQ